MMVFDFFKTLYGNVTGGFLTVWTRPDKRTVFFPTTELEAAAKYSESRFDTHDVYYGVGLRKEPLPDGKRGGNADISCISAFWSDIDVKSPAHKETALPETNDEAMAFLDTLPLKPSIVVSSGNGLHVYWLFETPLGIATEEHRANISAALFGWQGYINNAARERGWKLDNTSDLARALRVPGGVNHKLGDGRRSEILFDSGFRFSPSDFTPYIPKTIPHALGDSNGDNYEFKAKVGTSDKVISGCVFMRYCRDNSASLPEPQWYAMVGNLALCSDGREICHAFSKDYPGYNAVETDNKIQHAQQAKKPHTCEYIRSALGFEGCSDCRADCKSPVGLAVITHADEVKMLLEGEIPDWASVFDDAFIAELSYAKSKMPGDYAKFKMRIKGKVNIPDLEKCIKTYDSKFKHRSAADGEQLELDGLSLTGAVLPSKWSVTLQGGVRRVITAKDGEFESVACPDAVTITRRLVNLDSGDECLELSFFKDNQWKQVVGARTKVYNKASILGFGDKGLHVTSGTAADLVNYLSDFEISNKNIIPRISSIDRLGWLDNNQFYPYAVNEEIMFEEDKGTAAIYRNLSEQGDFSAWKEMMKKLRENPVARFITSASFASPLLCKIGVRTFVIHLWHTSGSGKTAALKAAISVWGNPLRIMGNGFTTIVGTEQLAGTLRNLPFGIDEKQSADERRLSLEQLVYVLGQGSGKIRGAKGGGNAEVATWHNIVMLTGEEPITRNSSLDGVQTRTFEIYGKPIEDMEFAKEVHITSENNYGFAGAVFMRAVCAILNENPDSLKNLLNQVFSREFKLLGLKNIHADYVAAIALGDYLAETILFGTDRETAIKQALECGQTVYAMNENQLTNDAVERAWDFVQGWLVSNTSRFNLESSPYYGKVTPSQGNQNADYFVIPQYLDYELEKAGFNIKKTLQGFRERGYIHTYLDSSGKLRTKTYGKIDGKTLAGYLFSIQNDGIKPLCGTQI
jgi:uncharacterized protein (DUF927 family)